MVNVATKTLNEVDVILWLVEPTNYVGAGEQHIAEQLRQTKTPKFLIINKVDTVKKEEILQFIDTYRKLLDFDEIIPVSALKGINTDEVIKEIFKVLPYGPMFLMRILLLISQCVRLQQKLLEKRLLDVLMRKFHTVLQYI